MLRTLTPAFRRAVERFLPPLLAFLAARALLWLAASHAGADPWIAQSWAFADSAHYLSIAERGYELFSCSELGFGKPEWWCGNTAWFPGYSWGMALLASVGLPFATGGVILSASFALATLLLFWIGFMQHRVTPRNVLCLTLVALFPGLVYAHAVFPTSMVTFFSLLFLWALWRERSAMSALSGFAAGLCYSTAFLLAPIALAWILMRSRGLAWRERIRRILCACGGVTAGVFTVFAVQAQATGAWDAFFKVQGKYDPGFHNPVVTFTAKLSAFTEGGAPATAWQAVFVAALMLYAVIRFLRPRAPFKPLSLLLALHAAGYWLLPLSQGTKVSFFRAEALLLPLSALLRDAPVAALVLITGLAATLSYELALLFFRRMIE